MITLTFPLSLSDENSSFIKELQREQSSLIRSSYKLASKNFTEKEMRIELKSRTTLDSWFHQSAIRSGLAMVRADRELGVVSRIFGGKSNFFRRSKGLITKDQFQETRMLPLYLIGEGPQFGNRKFDFRETEIIFKPQKGKKIVFQVPNLKKNWGSLYLKALEQCKNKKLPITVSLTSTFINLSFELEEKQPPFPKSIRNRYAGIDFNPNYIGISVFQGKTIISTKLFDLKNLTGKNSSDVKLEHETIEIGHSIGRYLKHLRVDKLFIEDLSFKQGNKGFGSNFNRLTINKWKRLTLETTLSKYYKLYKINAAYTSTIGNILNQNLPDPIASSTEIARRGFDLIVLKNKMFYPELPTITYLEDLWKETEIPVFKTWIELHSFVKNSKLRYRVPIPSLGCFRFFKSKHSGVYVL